MPYLYCTTRLSCGERIAGPDHTYEELLFFPLQYPEIRKPDSLATFLPLTSVSKVK